MKKHILRVLSLMIALCLLVICPLSIFAATMPSGDPDRTFTITADNLLSANKVVTVTTYSPSQGYINVTPQVDFYNSSNYPGFPENGVIYSLFPNEYRRQNITNFYNIDSAAITHISSDSAFDWFFTASVAIYIPSTNAVTDLYFRTLTVVPIYENDDGLVKADLEHGVVQNAYQYTEIISGVSYEVYLYRYRILSNTSYVFAVSPDWIPAGYRLSGFGFNININRAQDYVIPAGNRFYFSEIKAYGFEKSNATTRAIQQQTIDLTREMNDVGISINSAIQDSADQISTAIHDSTDQIINADLGYTSPTQGNTDDGLAMGNDLVNDMNSKMANFSDDLGNAQTEIISDMSAVSGVVNNIWATVPAAIVALVVAYLAFLVIRKLTGR